MAVTTAIISACAAVAGAVVTTVNNIQNQKTAEAVNKYNAEVAEQDAVRTRAEGAINRGLARASGRRQIASAKNVMLATGNVGSSSDASIYDSFLNLDSDLSAMRYQYDSTAVKYLNEAQNYRYNAKVAKKNQKGALMGLLIGLPGLGADGYDKYSRAGGQYGYGYWKSGTGASATTKVS